MSNEPSVACPRCAGGKNLTADRIQELVRLGHPVQHWNPGKCEYCGGVGAVPAIVAELVPLHDNNATPSRSPFGNRQEFLGVLDRLEQSPFSAYRDDAWASAACLLIAADFERGDLPAEVWRRGQPFLFENSLGRVLAAEIAMGLFSVPEAVETAFRPGLSRAAGMPERALDASVPLWLLRHAGMWLQPDRGHDVATLFTRHLADVEHAGERSVILANLLVTLARTCAEKIILDDDLWQTLLASQPKRVEVDGMSLSPLLFVIQSLCDDVLPKMPRESIYVVLATLVRASENNNDYWWFSTYVSEAILKCATRHLDDAGVDEIFRLLVESSRRFNNDYLPNIAGLLAKSLAISGTASESRLRTLVDIAAATNDDECWHKSGGELTFALGTLGDEPWSWTLFQDVVNKIRNSRTNRALYWGVCTCGEGLAQTSPAWKTQALFLLLDIAESSLEDARDRAEVLHALAGAVFQQWQDAAFADLYARLLTSSAEQSADTREAFECVAKLNFPLRRRDSPFEGWREEAQPAYRTVITSLFDAALGTVQSLPVAAQVAASDYLAAVFGRGLSDDVCELLFPSFLAFLDAVPVGDASRTKALSDVVIGLCHQDRPFDLAGISAMAPRLGDAESGPNKCSAIRRLTDACDLEMRYDMRGVLDIPEGVRAIATAIAAVSGLCDYRGVDGEGKNVSGASLAARFSRVFDDYKASLPHLDVLEYEALFAGARRLPGSVFQEKDANGRVKRRYVPRYVAQAALLRRLGPIGDDGWRLGFIQRVLDDLKEKGKPEHSRQLVHAILEALGSVDVGEWHKEALEKVLAFLAWEREADDSVMRRGIVTQLIRVGDLTQAARVAREVSSPTLRGEALAEVARGMAASLPDDAIALMQEIVSPEMRTQLAVELSASLPTDAERAWILLETSASDPGRLQEIAVQLLSRDSNADYSGLLGILGWTPDARSEADGVAAVLEKLVTAECITGKKRDRILGKMTSSERAAVERDIRGAAVAALVRLGLVAAEEAADFEPHRQ